MLGFWMQNEMYWMFPTLGFGPLAWVKSLGKKFLDNDVLAWIWTVIATAAGYLYFKYAPKIGNAGRALHEVRTRQAANGRLALPSTGEVVPIFPIEEGTTIAEREKMMARARWLIALSQVPLDVVFWPD